MKTLFTILLAFLCLFTKAQVKHIVTENAKIKKEDQPSSAIIGYISAGDTILVNSFKSGYWNITKGQINGYVSELFLPSTPDIEYIRKNDKNAIPKYEWPLTVRIGINKAELVHLLGEYTEKNTTTIGENTHDQVIYRGNGYKDRYYYFDNDKLTAMQE